MEQPPPPYSETSFMGGRFIELPGTIRLEGETVDQSQGIHAVYIRDSSECLLAKADVNTEYGAIRFTNSSGFKYLEVKSTAAGDGESTFKVFHQDMQIGNGGIKNSLVFTLRNTYENRANYKINSLKLGDIAVLREIYAPPICNMHLPGSSSSSKYSFDGVITFPEGNSITKVEQCLCLSLAIVFVIEQNRARIATASEGQCLSCCMALVCMVVIGLIMFLAFIGLEKYSCNKKKREGWAGYKNREC